MSDERGATLIGTLAIGFAVVFLVGQSLLTIGQLSSAATAAEEAAGYAATWAARHGDASDAERIAQRMMPEARVDAVATATGISVVVKVEVGLVGPEGSAVTRTVTGRAEVPTSKFRSDP
jgi:hypothetical protein